jgi:hypothetical protein
MYLSELEAWRENVLRTIVVGTLLAGFLPASLESQAAKNLELEQPMDSSWYAWRIRSSHMCSDEIRGC